MTPKLHSAGTVDQECLHVTLSMWLGLTQSTVASEVVHLFKLAQESRSIPEEGRLCVAFSGLASFLLYSIC